MTKEQPAVPDLLKGLLVVKRSQKSPEVIISPSDPETLFAPAITSTTMTARRRRAARDVEVVKYSPIKSGGTTPMVTIHRKKRRSIISENDNENHEPPKRRNQEATTAISRKRKKKKKKKKEDDAGEKEDDAGEQEKGKPSPVFGSTQEEYRTSIDSSSNSVEAWTNEELDYLKCLVDNRSTMTIQWEQIALGMLSKRRHVTADDCEAAYFDLVSQDYCKSTKKKAKACVSATPVEGFNARDPTRKFKMTQMLAERNFKEQPTSLISPISAKQYAKRYSFLNDSFCDDLAQGGRIDKTPSVKSTVLLDDALPHRKQNNWKLDDDRFLQKLKRASHKGGRSREASTTKQQQVPKQKTSRIIKGNGSTLDRIVNEAVVATDAVNKQCITAQGLQEELIALSNHEEEQNLINQELTVVEDDASIIT